MCRWFAASKLSEVASCNVFRGAACQLQETIAFIPLTNVLSACSEDSFRRLVQEEEQNSEAGKAEGKSEEKTEEVAEGMAEDLRAPSCGSEAFDKWRRFAWQTASALGVMAVTLFSAAASVLDTDETLWKVCFGIVLILLLAAGVAASVFVRDFFCVRVEEEPRDGQPLDAVARV